MEGIGNWIFNLYINKLVMIIYYFPIFKITTVNSFIV